MRFTKMQGVGNDFVLLNGHDLPLNADLPALARQLCARHFGIGADGLLVVALTPPADGRPSPASQARVRQFGLLLPSPASAGEGGAQAPGEGLLMRMFNPDGSEDMCGNGLRCVGLWAHRAGWLNGTRQFTVQTKEGPRRVQINSVSEDGQSGVLTVDMGVPRLLPQEVPFCGARGAEAVIRYPLTVGGEVVPITAVSTGSTHTVIFGDAPPDEDTFQRLSPLIETHPLFPERTSVLWATPRGGSEIAVRIWERGAGETLGCGTGACAVAVAARLVGLADTDAPLDIISKGGTLTIDWPGGNADIAMTGPAVVVFEGTLAL